jgi:hypothetical protein
VNGTSRLTHRCLVPGCPHVIGHGHFLCRPCWNLVPEPLKAAVWAAVFAAIAAASELQEVTA